MILATKDLPAVVRDQVHDRLRRPDLGRWLGQVEQVGHCSHPIRVIGGSDTIDPATGVVLGSYRSGSEPDGVTYLRCGNRRRAVCPSCSHQYQGDVFHLIMAGAAGGSKDVPADVVTHPLVFATFTAPSFGLVHAVKKPGRKGTSRCRPRSGGARQLCPHGRPRWCMTAHKHGDPAVGEPLCPECYDYTGHLVWQWWAPELWRRFTITLRRQLARHLGVSEAECRRRVRVQFAKVAEFQRRGLVHFHALIRLDGPPTPTEPFPPPRVGFGADTLADLVTTAAGLVSTDAVPVDGDDVGRVLRFGRQVDARPVHDHADRDHPDTGGALHPETVSAYVAKYATKAAADVVDNTGTGGRHLVELKHVLGRLVTRAAVAGLTGPDGPYKGWGRWVDMLGFRGHFATKSRRYSTTLGRLRQARRDHTRRQHLTRQHGSGELVDAGQADGEDQELVGSTLVIGSWRFAGIGWLTTGDAALAAASAARARDD